MPRPIGNKADLIGIGPVVVPRRMPIEHGTDLANEINVPSLGGRTDVVSLSRPSLPRYRQQRARMVFHMDPIANVFAPSVDRNRAVAECRADHGGDELLQKLVWPVIV